MEGHGITKRKRMGKGGTRRCMEDRLVTGRCNSGNRVCNIAVLGRNRSNMEARGGTRRILRLCSNGQGSAIIDKEECWVTRRCMEGHIVTRRCMEG